MVVAAAACGEGTIEHRDPPDGGGGIDAGGGDRDGGRTADAGAPVADAGPMCEEALTIESASALGHSFRHYRPHYGARAEGHASCSLYWSNVLPDFTYRSSWGTGCHATRYYLIEGSITGRAGWAAAVEEAFRNWDIPTACTPHWVRTTDAARAHVVVRAAATSPCVPDGSTRWFACAWSGWSITLNTGESFGVGVDGRLDVESLVTVELAHVMHFAHSPDPRDSVSVANAGTWGSTSVRVPSANSCGFTAYTACVPGGTCGYEACPPRAEGGCGNYRSLRPGDFALAEHLAGRNPSPPHAYDDGSVPAGAEHFDVAMLKGSDMAGTTQLYTWSGGASSFTIGSSATRWDVTGFPLDRVEDRMVAGDWNGDGRDDVATVMPQCAGGARVHVWTSGAMGFTYGGDAGSADLDDVDLGQVSGRVVAGDFDGDDADDLALFEQRGGTAAAIRVVRGGDAAALADAGVWWMVDAGYDLAQVGNLFVAGDFDGDGRDDVATAYQYPDGYFRYHVWISTGTALTYSGADGWYQSGPFSLGPVQGRLVAGDWNRDGRTDLAMLRGSGGAATMHAWLATTSSTFAYQSGPWTVDSGYNLANVGDRVVAGDFDRDGRDDITAAYQYADGTFRFHVWQWSGSAFAYGGSGGWYTSGTFTLSLVGGRLVAGSFD